MAKKKEPKVKLERSYNIPLRKSFRHTPKYKKTPKAVRAVRLFLEKHMKAEPDKIRLGMHLNEHLWKHGIKNPPHHVKVRALKEDNVINAELEGFEFKEAVKAEKKKKKEPVTMKEKLAAKLGVKEEPKKEKVNEDKKEEKPKKENKLEQKPSLGAKKEEGSEEEKKEEKEGVNKGSLKDKKGFLKSSAAKKEIKSS